MKQCTRKMGKGLVNSKKVFKPTGQFSKAILVECNKLLFISGEGPINKDGNLIGKGDIKVQTRQTFINIQNHLFEVGATFKDVVKMTYFLTDVKDVDGFREARKEFIKGEPPTASLIIVKALTHPDMKIEIEAIAAL